MGSYIHNKLNVINGFINHDEYNINETKVQLHILYQIEIVMISEIKIMENIYCPTLGCDILFGVGGVGGGEILLLIKSVWVQWCSGDFVGGTTRGKWGPFGDLQMTRQDIFVRNNLLIANKIS